MKAPGADVFHTLVEQPGHAGDFPDRILGKIHLRLLGPQQLAVLLDQCPFRLGEYAAEVFFIQTVQDEQAVMSRAQPHLVVPIPEV